MMRLTLPPVLKALTIAVALMAAGLFAQSAHAEKYASIVIDADTHEVLHARNADEAFDLPLLLWDERWSTQSAEAAMIGQDMSRAKRAEAIDSHAAAVILQGAIDRLAGGVI